MALALIPYPDFNPVLLHIYGPFSIRWYALSYIAGLVAAWWYLARASREAGLWKNPLFNGKPPATADQIGDFFVWATIGVIVGGRLGFVLIYGTFFCGIWGTSPACHGLPMGYLTDPIEIVAAWKGGMSFHGGLLGVAIALILYARKNKLDTIALSDFIATIAPIGRLRYKEREMTVDALTPDSPLSRVGAELDAIRTGRTPDRHGWMRYV